MKGNSSAEDIMAVLGSLLASINGDTWGKFTEAYPMDDESKNMPAPVVTWRLIREEPAEVNGRKQWKLRATGDGTLQKEDGVVHFHQPIESEVRIGCWHTTPRQARDLAMHVSEVMALYGASIQEAGAAQIIWLETTSDIPESDRWRLDLVPYFIDYRILLVKQLRVRVPILNHVRVEVRKMASSLMSAKEVLSGTHWQIEES